MPERERPSSKKAARANLERAFSLEGPEEAQAFYDRWANDYDRDVQDGFGSIVHNLVAAAAARHLPVGAGPILDMGCGTGLAGKALRKLGSWRLHGLDISAKMLAKAKSTGLYDTLVIGDLSKPLEFDNDEYAGAFSSGTFTLGHVGAEVLDEITRVLEPGAPFIFSVHTGVWKSSGFAEALQRLGSAERLVLHEAERQAHIGELPDQTSYICVARIL